MITEKKTTRLYRIMDFSHAVQMFKSGEIFFSHPSRWDDPYEKRVTHQFVAGFYAQCWSYRAQSDALWRIYSPQGLGVRISTTEEQLMTAIKESLDESRFRVRGGKVSYFPPGDLRDKLKSVEEKVREKKSPRLASEALYLKRRAFSHEHEWRVAVFDRESTGEDSLKIRVNPHGFINGILLDPRAPKELIEALQFYFTEKIKFSGVGGVRRSKLYMLPMTS